MKINFSRRDFLYFLGGGVSLLSLNQGFQFAQNYFLDLMPQVYIDSPDKLDKKFEEDNKKHGILESRGYISFNYNVPAYSEVNIIHKNDYEYIAKNHFFDDFRIIKTLRLFGKHYFILQADARGEYYERKFEFDFLDNDKLLQAILKDALTHNNWKYSTRAWRESHGNPVESYPDKYGITIEGVDYKINSLEQLTEGNRKMFEELWKFKVLYG